MARAVLFTEINWDPDGTGAGAEFPGPDAMRLDLDVTDPDNPVTIVVSHNAVSVYTKDEPVQTFAQMPPPQDGT